VSKPASISLVVGLTAFAERMPVLSGQVKEEEFSRANSNSLISYDYSSSPEANDEIIIFLIMKDPC
jgi:hypothetical protein